MKKAFLFLFIGLFSCSKTEEIFIESDKIPEGTWKLHNLVINAKTESLCDGLASKERVEIRFEGNTYSGLAPINTIGGKLTYLGNQSIKIETVGTTFIGGPVADMNCESQILEILLDAKEFKVIRSTTKQGGSKDSKMFLQIGKGLPTANGFDPKGTYLIFVKDN